jgi:FtsP/CotA-like multicopper oxidase with cupredoxin domain
MTGDPFSRRTFLKTASAVTAASFLPVGCSHRTPSSSPQPISGEQTTGPADYTLHIGVTAVEIAPDRIISITTYNGQFPGPLLRFKEGKQVTVAVYNDTDTPEQLHWHGQIVPSDVDGSAEEGTPFVPPHSMRRITFTPRPSGFRFYTHVRAGANLGAGQYSGQVGPVYIEGAHETGDHDREVFLVLKEFEPTLSRGGDMAQEFLLPSITVPELKERGESSMKASLAKGMPKGYEVGYDAFTIKGRMLGNGAPVRVKQGERVLFHVLNGSAGGIRSLALPGHTFLIVAMDESPPSKAGYGAWPMAWYGGTNLRHRRNESSWCLDHGRYDDDDPHHGMGIVVEYAGYSEKPQWIAPHPFHWNYGRFSPAEGPSQIPDQAIEMTFAKDNAALEGFNRWTINRVSYPLDKMMATPFHLKEGKRYRLRMRNASDDIHPIHLHRHTFELPKIAGQPTSGVLKAGGHQEAEIDLTADNPGLTLYHCHQQLHMDYGFMSLFDYV